ncbi:cytochrome P450 [Williamsia sp. CHRR-6]|uniref:cytochrome P450 n=1 Tax=Williamsia sp. CHRR-6 TaxID=2835871 RepID=UPI001BD9E654|nr:cytochrome P450 [Williamsia sp. CHRR-6]MBT0566485.1 cytochrome P450 [Williamsia sp. CHRR-6]
MSDMTGVHRARTTQLPARLRRLLADHRDDPVFRLEPATVGVTDPTLMDAILTSRTATDIERPTFRPLRGRSIPRHEATFLMREVGKDVRAALDTPIDGVDLTGRWPDVVHEHLRNTVFGHDPQRMTVMVNRELERTPVLTWLTIAAAATPRLPSGDRELSALATAVSTHGSTYAGRRHALGLYRRLAAPVCFTVAAVVTNAVWLGSPFDDSVPNSHIIAESLRLLPVSWNILRLASAGFTAVDPSIRSDDDVLLLPFLSHRSSQNFADPDQWQPQRWNDLDVDTHPGYLPFGHLSERCWGRHMVLPLASRILDVVREQGLRIAEEQHSASVPLAGMLGVTRVEVTRT